MPVRLAAVALIGVVVTVGPTSGRAWPPEDVVFGSLQAPGWRFGNAVDVDGDTAIVGAFEADAGGVEKKGEAYVFVRRGSDWVEEARLEAFDGRKFDRFGRSVAVDGDRVAVGASGFNPNGRGAVYVFTRGEGAWTLEQQLLASDGDELDQFGHAVALDGSILLIGARSEEGAITRSSDSEGCQGSGAAYFFALEDGTWVEKEKVFEPEGQCGDAFGTDVAVDGTTALVGAPGAQFGADTNRGAGYVYTQVGGRWVLQQRLDIAEPTSQDQLGSAVDLDRDVALLGAEGRHVGGEIARGAAYLFQRSGSRWSEVQQLIGSGTHEFSNFGREVALRGGVALVAASLDILARPLQGVVYEYRLASGRWTEVQLLQAPDGHGLDGFGRAMALNDERLIAGQIGSDVFLGGAAWIFLRPILFTDGFESGDTAEWEAVVTQ